MADAAKKDKKKAAKPAGKPAAAPAKPLGKGQTLADIKARTKKPKSEKTPKAVVPRPFKRYGRLWARAVFTGFKRGLRNQHENHAILKIDGCRNRRNTLFYIGKKCVYVYKARTKESSPTNSKNKTKVRAIWGKVTRSHGDAGSVRARFTTNLPGHAMGHRIRIVSHKKLSVIQTSTNFYSFSFFRCCTHQGSKIMLCILLTTKYKK
jgi:large subunit ribosomal protein L35Ae